MVSHTWDEHVCVWVQGGEGGEEGEEEEAYTTVRGRERDGGNHWIEEGGCMMLS